MTVYCKTAEIILIRLFTLDGCHYDQESIELDTFYVKEQPGLAVVFLSNTLIIPKTI